jgi:PST family polysaccharide transporter
LKISFLNKSSILTLLVNNTGWLFLDKVIRLGVGFFVGIWLARHLGPEEFGILSFSIAFVGLFSPIASLGLKDIVIRELISNEISNKIILGSAVILQAIGSIIAITFILITINYVRPNYSFLKVIISILSLALIFKLTDVISYWFESQLLSKYTVLVQSGCYIVSAFLKVYLILNNASLILFVWVAFIEVFLVGTLLCLMFSFKGLGLHRLRFSISFSLKVLKSSWPLLLSSMSIALYMKVDQIMLGQMLNDKSVGIYSVAVKISEVFYFIPIILTASAFPLILEAKHENNEKFCKYLQLLFNILSTVSILISLIITFSSGLIIELLFETQYKESGPILMIHVWASIFVFTGVASSKWFIAQNLEKIIFVRTTLNLILNILLNYLLIPTYGALGAAIALLITQSFGFFVYDQFRKDTRELFYMKLNSLNILNNFKFFLNKI